MAPAPRGCGLLALLGPSWLSGAAGSSQALRQAWGMPALQVVRCFVVGACVRPKPRAAADQTSLSLSRARAALDDIRNVMYVLPLFSFDPAAGRWAGWPLCLTPLFFFRGGGPGPGLGLAQPTPPKPEAPKKTVVSLKYIHTYHTTSLLPQFHVSPSDVMVPSTADGLCLCLCWAWPLCHGLGPTRADHHSSSSFSFDAAWLMMVTAAVFYSATRHGRAWAPSRTPSSETSRLSRYVEQYMFHLPTPPPLP